VRKFEPEILADNFMFRDLLRGAAPALMSKDILFSSVGIENYLSRSLVRDAARKKQAHSLVIHLTQINSSVNMIGKLLEISNNSSRLVRERAEKICSDSFVLLIRISLHYPKLFLSCSISCIVFVSVWSSDKLFEVHD
jgi:hypothetical protein